MYWRFCQILPRAAYENSTLQEFDKQETVGSQVALSTIDEHNLLNSGYISEERSRMYAGFGMNVSSITIGCYSFL